MVDVWREHGQPGERLAEFIDRVRWQRFVEMVGLGKIYSLYQKMPDYVRTYMYFRQRSDARPRFRDGI